MVSRISGSVEEVFSKFDTDKSGSIDAIELKKVFELLKCPADEVRTVRAVKKRFFLSCRKLTNFHFRLAWRT
jgi:EF-hand domain